MNTFDAGAADLITNALNTGASVADACAIAKISEDAFYRWCAIGEAYLREIDHPKAPRDAVLRAEMADFATNVRKAQAAQRVRALATIIRAGQDRWLHRKTGTLRTAPPPPITWFNTQTGEVSLEIPAAGEIQMWKREWSGEAWEFIPGDWRAYVWYLENEAKN
jgi:hypothetical protein